MGKKESTATSLESVLSDTKCGYIVPTLQRNYEWAVENINELWIDLFPEEFWADPDYVRTHFMGTLVLCERDAENMYDVLDGQQRLTTLSLMLAECYFRMQSKAIKGHDYLHSSSARNGLYTVNSTGKKLLRLSLQPGVDHLIYEYIMTALPERADLKTEKIRDLVKEHFQYAYGSRNKIYRTYLHIIGLFDKTLNGIEDDTVCRQRLDQIANRILHKVDFLLITAKSTSAAYKIFESLNDRGVELSQADLLKSKLCSYLDTNEEIERFKLAWGRIRHRTDSEPKGILSYLRAYANITTRGGVPRKRKDMVRKDELVEFFDDELRGGEKVSLRKAEISRRVIKLVDELDAQCGKYTVLMQPEAGWTTDLERLVGGQRGIDKVDFLQALGAKSCRPVLLAAFKFEYKKTKELLDLILNVQFRASIIAANPNEAEKVHFEVAQAIAAGADTVDIRQIEEMYLGLFPSNQHFFEKFMKTEAGSVPVWRHFLKLYHVHTEGKEVVVSGSDDVQVEHVLAQKATEEARIESGVAGKENDAEFERLVYLPGNLTLLDSKLNNEAKNSKFTHKRDHKDLQVYSKSKIPMNAYFGDPSITCWNAAQVERRTAFLARIATEIWPHPREGAIAASALQEMISKLNGDEVTQSS